MKETLNFWLSRNTRQPGVLAGAVRYADKSVFAQSWDPSFPAQGLELAWKSMDDTLQVMQTNRLPASRWCWTYERACIHIVRRADGICLGLVTANDPGLLPLDQLNRVFEEFERMQSIAG